MGLIGFIVHILERIFLPLILVLALCVLANNLLGCSSGPPIQAPPTTINNHVTITCGREPDAAIEAPPETTPERTTGGCSSVVWVDSSTDAQQDSRTSHDPDVTAPINVSGIPAP